MAWQLATASLPPFRMHALPAFRQSAKQSKQTLGRASKMMPMTPKGTLTRRRRSPFGRVVSLSTRPRGDGSSATWRRSAAMSRSLASVSCRRS